MEARPITTEKRSRPTSWDLMKTGGAFDADTGIAPTVHLAENLAVVTACVSAISETAGMLPPHVYRLLPDGSRKEDRDHAVARLIEDGPNDTQSISEFIEMMTAHCLLRGNSYAEIVRNNRGEPIALNPFHPDLVSAVELPRTGRIAYDVSMRQGGTRRLLPEEMLHLKDRSDDGIVGKSRLSRARETFASAIATERYAASTFKNGAAMSGILSHPEAIGEEAATRLQKDFRQAFSGADKAGAVAVLEEGLKWQQISVSPDDAQMLESRRFSTLALARIFRVPPPVVGELEGSNYSAVSEIGRWFYSHTMQPWLNKWEKLILRALFSAADRRRYEVEFDTDLLLRGDMLSSVAVVQGADLAHEIGMYNANELRKFENANKRTDPEGDVYFAPANMAQEQTKRPIADRSIVQYRYNDDQPRDDHGRWSSNGGVKGAVAGAISGAVAGAKAAGLSGAVVGAGFGAVSGAMKLDRLLVVGTTMSVVVKANRLFGPKVLPKWAKTGIQAAQTLHGYLIDEAIIKNQKGRRSTSPQSGDVMTAFLQSLNDEESSEILAHIADSLSDEEIEQLAKSLADERKSF